MYSKKVTIVVAFALFSLFFGAGNLILPPQLGFKASASWWLVAMGFCISAVLIPILGILAHARLQGSMFDFAKKVSPKFSLIYSFIVYTISITLPSPRTASVTHEMGIQPFFNSSSLLTSIIYFILVFVFVINRSKILNIIGQILTPAIIIILIAIVGITVFNFDFNFATGTFPNPFSHGILEGYQTFDAIGSVVVGGVIIISINLKKEKGSYAAKKSLIAKAGLIAGLGLFLIYTGLIITGALMHQEFDTEISRTTLLSGISLKTLGSTANIFLSILVSLACFTTAVGIVAGAADFAKEQFKNSQKVYTITAIIGCVLGVLMGQLDVHSIIVVAIPALMFIYPITIVLILLNILPEAYATKQIFRAVVLTTILFSIPDFLGSIGFGESISGIIAWIPLINYQMGWVLPALIVFVIANLIIKERKLK